MSFPYGEPVGEYISPYSNKTTTGQRCRLEYFAETSKAPGAPERHYTYPDPRQFETNPISLWETTESIRYTILPNNNNIAINPSNAAASGSAPGALPQNDRQTRTWMTDFRLSVQGLPDLKPIFFIHPDSPELLEIPVRVKLHYLEAEIGRRFQGTVAPDTEAEQRLFMRAWTVKQQARFARDIWFFESQEYVEEDYTRRTAGAAMEVSYGAGEVGGSQPARAASRVRTPGHNTPSPPSDATLGAGVTSSSSCSGRRRGRPPGSGKHQKARRAAEQAAKMQLNKHSNHPKQF